MQWQDRVSSRMLEVPYVHTTFTLPHELNGLARRNPQEIYGLLMRSAWSNRVAISNNRFKYLADQQIVQIIYNNYRDQQVGQPAPKAEKIWSPLVAIDRMLQHVLPPYFQKARYYGIHAPATYKAIKDLIPVYLKRNKNTIRTLFQILHHLLQIKPYQCDVCQSPSYIIIDLAPDKTWTTNLINLPGNKAPPTGTII